MILFQIFIQFYFKVGIQSNGESRYQIIKVIQSGHLKAIYHCGYSILEQILASLHDSRK